MAVSKTNITARFAVPARFIYRLSGAYIVKNVRQALSVLQKIIVHVSRSLTVWQKQKLFCSKVYKSKCTTIDAAFEKHETEKKRTYNRRVLEVEKATFTPLVFSTTGGMGKEAELFHKRLASLIADKRNTSYSDCMAYLRKKLSFCLLRTVLAALRGYRGRPVSVEGCNIDINLLKDYELVQY